MPPSPLEGVLVADFSRVLAGPFASMLLGDLGAEVIKVEAPDGGDSTRAWGPPYAAGESTYYLALNRNKRSVVIDLRDDEGRALARRLAQRADVLIENFRPGRMERFGLGYGELEQHNAGLIYCSISGFGRTAGTTLPGYDILAQAAGGLMSITGPEGGEPVKVGVAVVDVLTGLFAANGILAALYERHSSGRGQRVDVSLIGSALAALVNQASGFLNAGYVPKPMGNRHPSIVPYETFPAADQSLVVAVGSDGQFAALCAQLELALADDPRFATNALRVEHRDELYPLLAAALRERPAAEWIERLNAAGVPCGPVNDVAQAFVFAERLGLEPVRQMVREDGTQIAQVASPIDLSRTPVSYRNAPPRLDQDGDVVKARLGDDR
jgi:crotonobetainyl-CoA:carnitine CoA-transferase CaiB-like acyl-CoA transferase